uniref:Uncharacterized protein n=1 Tax=Panagrolaimus sp. ES5 TaxID=591445 RepID=A0AC34F2Z7_9BILA
VFFTDSVYQPIDDHGLDIDQEADFRPASSVETKKETVKKPMRDFSNQKKITQKVRQFIEEDDLMRITKTIKKPKPGQLSCGVRRMKHDVIALSKLAPAIQGTVIGPTRLKVSEKAKLKELREAPTSIEHETDAPLAPVMLYPKETNLFAFRAPGYDIHTPLGNTQSDIRRSKVYKKATELAEIDTVIKKLDTAIIDLKVESIKSFQNQNNIKEPLNFEHPDDDEETCARIRPLLQVIRRPLIEVNLMNEASTSKIRDDHRVSSLAAIHSDINAEYSLYGDIRPEALIQEEMARRGYQHCNDYLGRIAVMAEGLERSKKIVTDENDPKSKKKSNRKNEATEKGDEMIKMVIKRIVPPKGKNTSQAATYQITKKEEPIEPKKKRAAPKKNPLEGKTSSTTRKQPAAPKPAAIKKKIVRLSFNTSASSAKSWRRS